MANRIISMRRALFDLLTQSKTPGDWQHIVTQIGMFSYTGLSRAQCETLVRDFSIYIVTNGRISISGLNESNVAYFAQSMDYVVRNVI